MKRTRLKKVSNKYGQQLRLYYEHTKPEWLERHPGCQFSTSEGELCGQLWGVTIHHKRGRGRYLNDQRFFMSVCPHHHTWIEVNKREAREKGYILYP